MKEEYSTPVMKVVAVRTERVILNPSNSLPIGGETEGTKAWSKEDNGDVDFGW